LSSNNILINHAGDLVGIVDWECIIAAPSWEACQLPEFLDGLEDHRVAEPLTEEQKQNEDLLEDHKDVIQSYERTQLRKFFLEEMGRIDPQWVQTYNEETTRRDVMVAIQSVEDGMLTDHINGWLDCLLEGRKPRITLSQSIADPLALD
jgi:hypothetical protein